MDDEIKARIEREQVERDYYKSNRWAFRAKEKAKTEQYMRFLKYGKEQEMTEKEYAQGIYIKKFTNQYGDWLSVSIKDGETYKNYKFYPKKEQKSEKYIEFYGLVDDWKPEKKEEPKQEENIVKFDDNEIPF